MAASESFRQILDAHKMFVQLRYEHWIQHEAYTGVWWLLLSAWILPWIAWVCLVNRRQLAELYCYGVTVMFITTLLDAIGSVQGLWTYPIKVIPFTPHLEPIDWGILPVTYMLVYQYLPQWKGFIIAQIVVATVYSFAGEPFLTRILENYLPLHWGSIYSFPIYLSLAIIPRATTKLLYSIEKKAKADAGGSTHER